MEKQKRHLLVEELFQKALALPSDERAVFLSSVCGHDPDLLKEVNSLIAADDVVESFLSVSPYQPDATTEVSLPEAQAISHYRIIKKLGAGGMGEVYLAEDTRLGRKVAIKFLAAKSIGDDNARRRLIREARAAAQLDHPNICAVYEVGEEENRCFIVMQYIEGETLLDLLKNKHPTIEESLDIARQILVALAEAHSQNVIHRDIKPQNVVITARGQVKVLDFGLAKIVGLRPVTESDAATLSLLTETGVVVGTVGYMSPEQAKGMALDARTDLFSVGALLYECVTRAPAFSGSNPIDICAQVIHVDPQPPSIVVPGVPPELDYIILKALAKDTDLRYQSANEMLDALIRFKDKDSEGWKSPPSWHDRKSESQPGTFRGLLIGIRARWVVVLALFLLVAVGLLIGWRLQSSSRRQPTAEAYKYYAIGAHALREGAYYQASKALEHAISLDKEFALAHARLAEAWSELDYEDRAKDELLRVASLVPDRSSLPEREALYLQAITETVTRNLGSAVETYRVIADKAPEDEKPFAYIDLGRAYEKSEDITSALQYYTEAGTRDSQLASAFLRAGIVHGRRLELEQALQAFDTTREIYEAVSNTEGITEVLYQRGVLLSNADRLPDARQALEQAHNMTLSMQNRYQQIRTLLQLSNLACLQNDTVGAERFAEQAVTLARDNGMENLTTQGLVDLGRSFFLRDKFNESEKYFRQALEFAQANKGRRNEARALLSLASVRVQQDKADEALQYLGPALEFFQNGGYSKEYLLCLSLLGQAHDLKSEYGPALQAYQRQNELALRVGNPSQTAFSHNGIGLMLSYGEDYPSALRHFEESYKIYESLKYRLYAGYSLINCADMLSRLGRYREAEQTLGQVSSIAQKADESYRQLSGGILLVSARTALSQRRFGDAKRQAKQALELAITRSPHSAVEAQSILGLAAAFSGSGREGIRECQQGVDTARRIGSERLLSIALLAQAEASLGSKEFPSALSIALQAQAIFGRTGRQESEWRSWLIAARASLETADLASTRKYVSHASGLLSELQRKWGEEVFAKYAERSDVQLYRKQLAELLAKAQ